jgi:hypothetical protein
MKQTAMQEVILKMQEAKDNFPNIGFDEEFIRGFNKAFEMAIFIVEKVGIDKEKQQILDAYEDGNYDNGMGRCEAEQYYNETFKKK